jgi:hypothetical protein
MSQSKTHRDVAFDKLIGAYYGGRRVIQHPVSKRWLPRTPEELLAGYYGKSRRAVRHAHATPPVSIASSVDDGETLRATGGDAELEEYVVTRFGEDAIAQSLSDASRGDATGDVDGEEYVVERLPMDALSSGASLSESDTDAGGECQVDVLYPLARPTAPNGVS